MAKEVERTMCLKMIEIVSKVRTREELIDEILKIFPDCDKRYLDTLSLGGLIDELNQSILYTE